MMTIRPADERGHGEHGGWLDSRFTFSFADYYDPKHMGFRALRVINDDHIAAARGFGMHGHRDMEILTYVLDGEVAHQDSMGTKAVVRPGEVQRMTAGTGVTHSEQNPRRDRELHLLQIWIVPDKRGYPPSYEQTAFPEAERRGTLRVVGSRDGRDGSVTIHQDVTVYAGLFDGAEAATLPLAAGRHAWVHVARGAVEINGEKLHAGDGAAISEVSAIELRGGAQAEVLIFDLA
jgi:hypothetical protein